MRQNEFFNILMDGLKYLPESKLRDIIFYYESNFTLGLANGKTEEEIINEFGNPDLIVNKYKIEDLKIPFNSEQLNNYTDIIHNKNFINDNIPFTKDPIIVTDNYGDFKTNDVLSSNNSNESNYSCNSEKNSDTHSNNFASKNQKNSSSQFDINTILRICIAFLAFIIFFPVITGVIGCVIGLFGVAISILVASIGVLVGGTFTSFIGLPNIPAFVSNFPYPVIVLFSLGSILLSIFLIILFYYLCKFFVRILIRIYNSLKSERSAF